MWVNGQYVSHLLTDNKSFLYVNLQLYIYCVTKWSKGSFTWRTEVNYQAKNSSAGELLGFSYCTKEPCINFVGKWWRCFMHFWNCLFLCKKYICVSVLNYIIELVFTVKGQQDLKYVMHMELLLTWRQSNYK